MTAAVVLTRINQSTKKIRMVKLLEITLVGFGSCRRVSDIILLLTKRLIRSQPSVPNYLQFSRTFFDDEKRLLIENFKVFNDFVSEKEESSLIEEVDPILKKLRYENGHWDNAIKGYRETQKFDWSSKNAEVLEKVKRLAFKTRDLPLEHVHVLDLDENGIISPHVDSVKFCGGIIAGISLLSDSVMRLTDKENNGKIVDAMLKRRSLYIMSGAARYDYTHEILGNEYSKFGDKIVKKTRRISLICRNEPQLN